MVCNGLFDAERLRMTVFEYNEGSEVKKNLVNC